MVDPDFLDAPLPPCKSPKIPSAGGLYDPAFFFSFPVTGTGGGGAGFFCCAVAIIA